MDKLLGLLIIAQILVHTEAATSVFFKEQTEDPCVSETECNFPRQLKDEYVINERKSGAILETLYFMMPDRAIPTVRGTQIWRKHPMQRQGIRVFGFGGTWANENRSLSLLQGKFLFVDRDVKSTRAKISVETAFTEAVKHEKDKLNIRNIRTSPTNTADRKFKREEKKPLIYFDETSQKAKLAYRFQFLVLNRNTNFFTEAFVTVDANTGDIIDSFETIISLGMKGIGGNKRTESYIYGEGALKRTKLEVTKVKGKCAPINKHVHVASALGAPFFFPPEQCFDPMLNEPFVENCNPKPPNDDETPNSFSQVHDGLFFATQFAKLLVSPFNETTLQKKCKKKIRVCVHWPDSKKAAFFMEDEVGCSTYFAVGDNNFYDHATSTTVAHEIAHALVALTSRMVPDGVTGAILESFCDFSGIILKASLNGWKTNWQFGDDITKQPGKAIRYMDNPGKDGQSIDNVKSYKSSLDPHLAAGIYSKAIVRLVTTSGWDLEKAYKLFLVASTKFWLEKTTFDEGVCGLRNAAEVLKLPVADVEKAFAESGASCKNIPPPPRNDCTFKGNQGKCVAKKKCKKKKSNICPKITDCGNPNLVCCFKKGESPSQRDCGN